MNRPARLLIGCAIALCAGRSAAAQATLQPTPPPAVTADSAPWYASGEPVTFAGNLYYLAGAQIHFNGNEMVRSGTYQGVPLYSRTTVEPYSLVFVPLAGGMMQPYERRRDGPLAGTAGSSAPSFPVATSRDVPLGVADASTTIEAPGPPMLRSPDVVPPSAGAVPNAPLTFAPLAAAPNAQLAFSVAGKSSQVPARQTATQGRVAATQARRPIVKRAGAQNGVFVEFDGARWFSSGPPAPLDTTRFHSVGEVHGFPVYAAREGDASTIYMPVSLGMDLVAPYTRRK